MEQELDFPFLDDILTAPVTPDLLADVRAARPSSLGPLVEYAYQSPQHPGLPPVTELPDGLFVRELRRVAALRRFDRSPVSTSHEANDIEFHLLPRTPEEFSAPAWIMFLRRLQNAAVRAGFQRRVPAGLTGAFGEMADNAFRHSQRPLSTLCGYRWAAGCLEYVIADAGQGVLASLRSCPDYTHLQDAGDALHTALTEGESRLGRGSGHGRGFRELFLSLADLSGQLRFRSGDHVLSIDGMAPDLNSARICQLGTNYLGLAVSVVCRAS